MTRTLALVTAVVLSLFLLAFAACGGGQEEPTETPGGAAATTTAQKTPTAGVAATPSEGGVAATPTVPPPVTVQVNKSFWHGGWKVTLGEATFATTIEYGYRTAGVSIDATFENLGDDTSAFNSQLVLAASGKNYTEPTSDHEIPEVPGNLKQIGKITFAVDPEFALDDAVLIVGRPENNQATIPLGPAGGDLVSLEPREVPVAGQAASGRITINLSGGDLRADIPDNHDEMKKGWLALTLRFSATFEEGNYYDANVMYSDFALTLPDGTSVAADAGSNELISAGTMLPDLFLRFGIRDPAQGAYTLRWGRAGVEPATVQFQIQ